MFYFLAVYNDGNMLRFTDLSLTRAMMLFDEYSNKSDVVFCQHGRAGEDYTNLYCKGATF